MLAYLAACGMGLGHAARMLAVARRLRESGVDIVFSAYGRAVEAIEEQGYRCLRGREVSYEVDEYGDVDVRRTVAKGPTNLYRFARQVGDELYFMGVLKPNVVISDSRLSSLLAAKARGLPALLVISQLKVLIPVKRPSPHKLRAKSVAEKLACKVLNKGWSLADEILIPDYPPPYTISKANILDEDVELPPNVTFAGPMLQAWPDELPSKEEVREELGVEGRLVVASFTGLSSEGKAVLESFLDALAACDLPDDLLILVSKGMPTVPPRVEKVGRRVLVYDWLPHKPLYIKAADALVTHGGHTSVLEAIAFGTPSIHVVKATHTERLGNSLSAQKLGVARVYVVGDYTEELCNALKWALSSEAWESAQSLAEALRWYRGDELAARRALKLAH